MALSWLDSPRFWEEARMAAYLLLTLGAWRIYRWRRGKRLATLALTIALTTTLMYFAALTERHFLR